MRSNLIKIALPGLLFFSCSNEKQNDSAEITEAVKAVKDSTKTDRQDSVEIIVQSFKRLFKENGSGINPDSINVYYINIGKEIKNITSETIVNELVKTEPKVKNGAELKTFTEKEKAKIGFIIFQVNIITTDSLNRNAKAACGYWYSRSNSSDDIITLTKEKGHWMVKDHEIIMISALKNSRDTKL